MKNHPKEDNIETDDEKWITASYDMILKKCRTIEEWGAAGQGSSLILTYVCWRSLQQHSLPRSTLTPIGEYDALHWQWLILLRFTQRVKYDNDNDKYEVCVTERVLASQQPVSTVNC